ncbi:MAG: DUF5655 domain-containing protein [Mollicutes bacterium]|nr:DUF5655 domain-containing protein [Mollicutes bacterium]
MIFENSNGLLKTVPVKEFKLEKDIQTLVEKNMRSLLGYEFLGTEFPIESFRFDSVAFDKENNSFVIIEYKNRKNEALVDQGLAYLNTFLRRKADFVLLYNEVKKQSKLVKDFDWSQTKLVFISPKFTSYQLKSVAFKNFANFHLFEIKQYANGMISFEEKEVERDFDANLHGNEKSEADLIRKEIDTYTEAEHLNKANEGIRELYELLKERILELGDIKIVPKKMYIAFKAATNVCDVVVRKSDILLMLNLQEDQLKDNDKVCRLMKKDGNKIGHWGNGDYQVLLKEPEELDYLMTLIRQSYKKNS